MLHPKPVLRDFAPPLSLPLLILCVCEPVAGGWLQPVLGCRLLVSLSRAWRDLIGQPGNASLTPSSGCYKGLPFGRAERAAPLLQPVLTILLSLSRVIYQIQRAWISARAEPARMPDFASGACDSSTCLNNGACDPNYNGTGFRCNCPEEGKGKVDYGPRCELLIRGYVSTFPKDTSTKYAMTKHDLSGHTFYPNNLNISFEFVTHCHHKPLCKFFVLRDASSNPLLTIEMLAIDETIQGAQVYLRSWITRSGIDRSATNAEISRDEIDAWSTHWQSLTIGLHKSGPQDITATLILCSLKRKECKDAVVATENFGTTDLQSVFKSSTVSIGRFVGCIRNVRVNGALVDLGNVADYDGSSSINDVAFTMPFCPFFMFSCQEFSRTTRKFERNYCGKDSQCNGEVRRWFSGYRESCTCRCINGKRRFKETVSDSEKCTKDRLLENECNNDSPFLSLGSTNFRVEWKMQNDSDINIGKSHMSLEANFRTRKMNCKKAFELVSAKDPVTFYIEITDGRLHAIIANDSYLFSNALVSDGEWHFFSLTLWKGKMSTTLDAFAQDHTAFIKPQFESASLVLSFPNSCVRAIRLSNIYMPTGDTDRTADNAYSFIKVINDSGVEASASTCLPLTEDPKIDDISSTVSSNGTSSNNSISKGIDGTSGSCSHCPKLFQQCRFESAVPTCECIDGYDLDARGNCIIGIEQIRALIPESCDSVRPCLLIIAFTAACQLMHMLWDFPVQP